MTNLLDIESQSREEIERYLEVADAMLEKAALEDVVSKNVWSAPGLQ